MPAPAQMPNESRLLALAGELRNKIWRDLIVREEPFPAFNSTGSLQHRTFVPWIAHTCRIIRKEVLSIFYSENTFIYEPAGKEMKDRFKIQQFLKTILPYVGGICLDSTVSFMPPVWRDGRYRERVLIQARQPAMRAMELPETFVLHNLDSGACVQYDHQQYLKRRGWKIDPEATSLEKPTCGFCYHASRKTGILVTPVEREDANKARKEDETEALEAV